MSPIIVKNTANIHNIFYIAKKIRNLDTKQPHHSKKIYRNFRFRFNLPTFEINYLHIFSDCCICLNTTFCTP